MSALFSPSHYHELSGALWGSLGLAGTENYARLNGIMSGEMSDKKPHGLRDQLSVCMPDETFEYTLEKMSDGMPDHMSEYMSVGWDHSKYGSFSWRIS